MTLFDLLIGVTYAADGKLENYIRVFFFIFTFYKGQQVYLSLPCARFHFLSVVCNNENRYRYPEFPSDWSINQDT